MSWSWDTILMMVVVALAALWAGRSIWRAAHGGTGCSSCASSGTCPLVNNPEKLEELLKNPQCPSKIDSKK